MKRPGPNQIPGPVYVLTDVKKLAAERNGLYLTKSVREQFSTNSEGHRVVREVFDCLRDGQYSHSLFQITDSAKKVGDKFDVYGVELDGEDKYFKFRVALDNDGPDGKLVCVISLHDPRWPLETQEGRTYDAQPQELL